MLKLSSVNVIHQLINYYKNKIISLVNSLKFTFKSIIIIASTVKKKIKLSAIEEGDIQTFNCGIMCPDTQMLVIKKNL